MTNLSKKELNEIEGGVAKLAVGTWIVIGGIASFIIGTINGYLRPLKCSSEK